MQYLLRMELDGVRDAAAIADITHDPAVTAKVFVKRVGLLFFCGRQTAQNLSTDTSVMKKRDAM